METKPSVPAKLSIRGFLLHLSHYDPHWCSMKENEKPFNLDIGLEVIDEMARAGLNLLVIDCEDGVEYSSHPELKRPYTVPMEVLRTLVQRARSHKIEIVPKINFSQSHHHKHNHWFRPHNDLFDKPEYWKLAFEVIDELIGVIKPERFFHIGMDEDHSRSYSQYIAAIGTLHAGLRERKLRAVIWNDSACDWPTADIHREKSIVAEKTIPKDVVEILWYYGWNGMDAPRHILQRIQKAGLEFWGAPGDNPEQVTKMKEALLENHGTGMLLTRWKHCISENRDDLLGHIRTLGPLLGPA